MKKSIGEVLTEMGFSKKESAMFIQCMKYVKDEQRNSSIDAEALISQVVKKIGAEEQR